MSRRTAALVAAACTLTNITFVSTKRKAEEYDEGEATKVAKA